MRRLTGVALLAGIAVMGQQRPPEPVTQDTLPQWKAIYFHDEDHSQLSLHDLAWPGENCIAAAGILQSRDKRPQAAILRSVDGGKTWSIKPQKDYIRGLYFLSERLGWAVTEEGFARTSDCGATWEPLGRQKNMVRVHFLDEARGFAVGAPKRAMATKDGGRTWTEFKPDDEPGSEADRSIYTWIDFVGEQSGVIVGYHQPRRSRRSLPAWMDPELAQQDRQLPSLTLMMQTVDGGAKWKGASSSLLGHVTRLRLAPQGRSLILLEFQDSFEWPSEVYRISGDMKSLERIFREKNRAITDLMQSRGNVFLAGIEPVGGSSLRLPIPGKVKILRSSDLKVWQEMPVDYRAVANRVMLARGPDYSLLAATDTGMILQLR